MSTDGEYMRWLCSRAGIVNLHRVSSMVREPCLHHLPAKANKMLKPEKWQAIFDTDGKVIGFHKALKLIVLGGVDPSIRAEVWEFLLGCYALDSTSEYRRQLRIARRQRYENLIKQCQMMHSSVGTGRLAYVVGSKLMDVRTTSKDSKTNEAVTTAQRASGDTSFQIKECSGLKNECATSSSTHKRKNCSSSIELANSRVSTNNADYEPSNMLTSSGMYNYFSRSYETEIDEPKFDEPKYDEPKYDTESFFDFPSLPVSNLFWQDGADGNRCENCDFNFFRFKDEHMHSFQINNNADLVIESTATSNDISHACNSEVDLFYSDEHNYDSCLSDKEYNKEIEHSLRISDVPETSTVNGNTSSDIVANGDRVSEWLWTLHRIVVDVVRTDSHLEFYGDSKNMARMSDILAVYAWVDPSTGYCQGMSDLLSPFIVLYEDNADAFWCFEMLLRRMRENFQMEGPTGVMKQLQELWKIVELTDAELFEHLSVIGAESLHFAFRMLLVLFRRELSFDEAMCMWEMMWAADFDEATTQQLEEYCLEPLVLDTSNGVLTKANTKDLKNGKRKFKSSRSHCRNGENCVLYSNGTRFGTNSPLCGLSRANFWARHELPEASDITWSTKIGDDELPVFCVAAILIINRQKIMRETHSIDDAIKMFNDNMLKINVKRCVRLAIKLRRKYVYKLLKISGAGISEQQQEEED